MPVSPVHGRRTHFSLDNAAGTLTDISNWLRSVQMQEQGESVPTTTFHPTNKRSTFLVGFVDGTIQLAGLWDPTIEAHLTAVLASDDSLSFAWGPQGNEFGQSRRTGECFLMSAPVTGEVNGVYMFTAELKLTGEVTYDTFPSA